MDAYGYLAFFLLLFVFFIYIVWFGYSVKVENQKEQGDKVKIKLFEIDKQGRLNFSIKLLTEKPE